MKFIKYNLAEDVNVGTEENPVFKKQKGIEKTIRCTADELDKKLAIARSEAFEEPKVTDDGQPETYQPTDSERIEVLEQALLEMMGVDVDG